MVLHYKGKSYPSFQKEGFASKFIFPFAKEFCKGKGYDIGFNRPEWKLEGAIGIDSNLPDEYDAYNLPDDEVDYIFSSHCLEHLPDWVGVLNYWTSKIKNGGTLFLYLPDYSQEYWRPWNNRKHVNILNPDIIKDYLKDKGYEYIFTSGVDLNNSFTVVGIKGS